MRRVRALIHLVMGADIKEYDQILKVYIDNSDISRNGESTLAGKFTSQA